MSEAEAANLGTAAQYQPLPDSALLRNFLSFLHKASRLRMQAPGSSAQRPIARRAHKKSKTGCRTCKIRKVKCDERRPLCVNCERHYRNLIACDFDNHDSVVNPGAILSTRINEVRSTAQTSQQSASTVQATANVGRDAEVLRLPQAVGAGLLDPFEARPISNQPAPSVDALIGHYLANFAYRSFPLYANQSLIGSWWPFVRNDELLFHIILLLSGLDRDRLQGLANSIHTRQLFDESVHLLNERLQDSGASVSDHTVVSIAAFAAMEFGRENMRALNVHLEGLRRVVELRGGLNEIRESNAMAANFAFWVAMVSINEPTFLPLTYGDEVDDAAWLYNPTTANLLTHDGSQADLLDFDVDVITANILHRVQRLSKLYAAKIQFDTPQEAHVVLSSLCSVLERLLRLSRSASSDSPIPGLSQSCRLAGCLHLFTPQSGYFPDPSSMISTLVHELKASLDYMSRAVGTNSYLLLWLLAVGGIAAHTMPPERSWFVGHLVLVVTDLEIQSWEEMRQHLVRLAFHDNFCDINFHALWGEVRAKQEALSMVSFARVA